MGLLIIFSSFPSFSQNGNIQESDNGKIHWQRECGFSLFPFRWKSCEDKQKDKGHISVSGNSKIEIVQYPNGATSFKISPIDSSPSIKRPTINLKQISIEYQLDNAEKLMPTKKQVNAKITQLEEGLDIYVGALHAFKYDLMKLSKETSRILRNYKIILFKEEYSSSRYYDLIFFLGQNVDKNQLFDWLQKAPKPNIGDKWQSLQLGFMGEQAVDQISEGFIKVIDDESYSDVVYFYLNEGSKNLTSNGSSGSLILSDQNQPLGLLQCKANLAGVANLRGSSGMWHYRAISFNSITNKHTEILESYKQLLLKLKIISISERQTDGICIPVDRNGAGGQARDEGDEYDNPSETY